MWEKRERENVRVRERLCVCGRERAREIEWESVEYFYQSDPNVSLYYNPNLIPTLALTLTPCHYSTTLTPIIFITLTI